MEIGSEAAYQVNNSSTSNGYQKLNRNNTNGSNGQYNNNQPFRGKRYEWKAYLKGKTCSVDNLID